MPALVLAGPLFVQLVAADSLPNAWQITDNTTSGDAWTYATNLPAGLHTAATNSTGGFRYVITNRFVTNFGGPKALFMAYGLGSRRFLVWWDLNGSGDLRAELEGGFLDVLTTNGTGRTHYHSHEITYNPTNGTASYAFDGQVKTNGWPSSANGLALGQAIWGAGSAAGKGQINFNSVTFRITNSVAASYDAGFAPAVAPNPTNSGWMLASGTTTAATNISPDTAFLPVAATGAADQLTNTSARLNGQANPSGSPTMAWFEWGTDTNYGNLTVAQNVGQGVSLSNLTATLTGLVGQSYNYRLAASNTFGVVNGANQSFNLSFLQTPIPGLPGVRYSSVAWGDYDNDGRLDFLLTGITNTLSPGVSQLWRNNLPLSNAPPAAPTGLSATTLGNTVAFNWIAPADDLTPAAGLNYNLRIGSAPGASDVLAPMALTNGLRLLPALGNAQTGTNAFVSNLAPGRTHYWSVQALDTSFAGSPFATEQQFFTVPQLINPVRLPGGSFEFHFTNLTALNFDVLLSTNVALHVSS